MNPHYYLACLWHSPVFQSTFFLFISSVSSGLFPGLHPYVFPGGSHQCSRASTLTSLRLPRRCGSPLHPLSQPHFQMSAGLFSSVSGRILQVSVSGMEFITSYCPALPRLQPSFLVVPPQLERLLTSDSLTSSTSPLLLPLFSVPLPTPTQPLTAFLLDSSSAP